jgi:flagellar hook-associated protein 1
MAGNGISSLLDISGRALSVQSQALRVIGNNIANVNTPGYSRRRADLVTTNTSSIDGAAFGSGVEIESIRRLADKFLNSQLQTQMNERGMAESQKEFLSRAEQSFAVDGSLPTIGIELSNFFSALEDLSVSPADIPLRAAVIDAGNNLSRAISSTYSSVAQLQREANDRIGTLVQQVNSITGKIADLNLAIQGSEIGGQENLSLRDERDKLLEDLAEKIEFKIIENADGTTFVTLDNGFGLVNSTGSKNLEFVSDPSFAPVGGFPEGLDGAALGHVVYDFDSGPGDSHIDLTNIVAAGGGEISGLLSFRGVQSTTDTTPFDAVGSAVDIATRVELVARDLLVRFNAAYVGPDENAGAANHQASSADLSGTAPSAFGLFSYTGAGGDADGIATTGDLTTFPSYANRLIFNVSQADRLAASLDQNPVAGATTFVQGDGSNIARLTALRNQNVDWAATYALGNYTGNSTLEQLYSQTVTHVGGLANRANSDLTAAQAQETQVREFRSSASGVNLDEEFASLIQYQRAFEASARMVRVGDDMLGEIIGLLGR